ncbi:unnamed protein product [Microthlaspi erraticum]|uniref:MATH domain-containing protein n=1 Tax=Microthlaspi erraticum TaxID=1685480 RepID=A0A6D2HVX8_9BRAS|nr:unnamed protein product [Microthlaspi erraticum]
MSRPIPIEEMVETFKRNHKTSHLFKIDNFSLLKKHQIQRVESSVFYIGGHKWKIIVYVVSQLIPQWHPKKNVKWNFEPSSTPLWKGFSKLMSLADLESKGFLIGDCCMFGATLVGVEPGPHGTAECFSLIEKPLNHRVTWLMTKFSSFEPGEIHYSNEFVVGNRKWRIKVQEKHKSFSVYLSGEGFINDARKTKTFAKFKLRVLDQTKQKHIEKTESDWVDEEPGDKNGFEDFMPLSKLGEPYLVNDKLYVGVDFEVISMTKDC